METIYELIKKHFAGNGEDVMWKSTEMISDAIERSMPEMAKKHLMNDLYGLMTGGHYDSEMAEADVEKMFFVDEAGDKHFGPFYSHKEVKAVYDKVYQKIPDYNEYDFYVVMNMVASDNHDLLIEWFPNDTADERAEKYAKMAVMWLDDKDWPTTDKIWSYLHK